MQPLPYLDLVARNVRVARAAVKLSQIDVAARMQALGFREWRRQTVGNTESGRRRLTVEEALGLMVALETDLTALVFPPAELEFAGILLPAGQETLLPAAKYSYNPDRASVWDGNVCLLKPYPHGGRPE